MTTVDTLGPWLDAVASAQATPGGGAVAGVQGAHAIALLEMVCRLTRGMEAHAHALEVHRAAFLELAEADMRAFGAVSKAFGLPRGDKEEKEARTAAIQQGLLGALEVPMDTIERVVLALADAARVATDTNPNVASDAGIGLTMLGATLDVAMYNVRINVRFLKDRGVGDAALARAQEHLAQAHEEIARLRALIEPHMVRG